MKILWMSDSPTTPSGFGNVTRFVCGSLADRGHQVFILGRQTQGMHGRPIPWHNCLLYPGALSNHQLLHYLHRLQPDMMITLANVWELEDLNYPVIANFLHTAGIPWVCYYPISAEIGEKRLPSNVVRLLKTVDQPVAMSQYGRDVMQANEVIPAYIPLGIDTKVFQLPADKVLAKQMLGYEGKFVVLSDVRNQLHKMLPRTLEIFQCFAADKDDVILHLHCDPDDPAARSSEYCYDLQSDIAFLNLTDKVYLTKDTSIARGLPIEQLAQIYQAADVHLLASLGEGFGLPTLQAAATGVVPLAADYSASRELVLNHGETIRVSHFLPDQFGLRHGLINIEDAVSKLETLYRDRQLLACKAQKARDFAISYDWERIVLQWEELLQHETPYHGDVQPERALRIPVTLPLTKSKQRIPGYIYAASQCDVPSVLALRRIFPGLSVWSTILLDFGSHVPNDKPLQVKVVQANSTEYRPHLAMSTLALDMGSFDPVLPIEATKLGVPCIGLTQQREQAQLWPGLSLEKPDPMIAAKLGRQMLTDQGVATDLCLKARQHLANALTLSNDEPLGSVRKQGIPPTYL
jgi:glycosyltransferase involved in cell wall biosynthesis